MMLTPVQHISIEKNTHTHTPPYTQTNVIQAHLGTLYAHLLRIHKHAGHTQHCHIHSHMLIKETQKLYMNTVTATLHAHTVYPVLTLYIYSFVA